VLIGARNEEQLTQNLGAIGWELTPEQVAKLDAASEVKAPYPYYPYRYYGPWRFGFVGPLISLFVFFFILRALMFALFGWGWGWRRRWWRYGPDFDPRYGPYAFEEWHRRAHEQMRDDRAPAPPTA
jgi:hypothetical protein